MASVNPKQLRLRRKIMGKLSSKSRTAPSSPLWIVLEILRKILSFLFGRGREPRELGPPRASPLRPLQLQRLENFYLEEEPPEGFWENLAIVWAKSCKALSLAVLERSGRGAHSDEGVNLLSWLLEHREKWVDAEREAMVTESAWLAAWLVHDRLPPEIAAAIHEVMRDHSFEYLERIRNEPSFMDDWQGSRERHYIVLTYCVWGDRDLRGAAEWALSFAPNLAPEKKFWPDRIHPNPHYIALEIIFQSLNETCWRMAGLSTGGLEFFPKLSELAEIYFRSVNKRNRWVWVEGYHQCAEEYMDGEEGCPNYIEWDEDGKGYVYDSNGIAPSFWDFALWRLTQSGDYLFPAYAVLGGMWSDERQPWWSGHGFHHRILLQHIYATNLAYWVLCDSPPSLGIIKLGSRFQT